MSSSQNQKLDLMSVEGLLALISAFAPLVPVKQSALIGKLSGIAGELTAEWKADNGTEPKDQLAAAHIEADANSLMILEDLARIAAQRKAETEAGTSENDRVTESLQDEGGG